jgi:hypothetical protein
MIRLETISQEFERCVLVEGFAAAERSHIRIAKALARSSARTRVYIFQQIGDIIKIHIAEEDSERALAYRANMRNYLFIYNAFLY